MGTIPVLRFKPGYRWDLPTPGGARILSALDNATKVMGCDLTLTAGTNDHTTGRHATGEAFDVSVREMTVPVLLRFVTYLKQALGERFTVLYETIVLPSDPKLAEITYVNQDATGSHVHVQVKKSTIYPPEGNVSYV